MSVRIMLSGGGTGGHVYPLLAVRAAMEDLQAERGSIECIFVGGDGIEKDLVAREALPYQSIRGGGVHGVGMLRGITSLFRLLAGTVQAWRALGNFRPQVIVATGGFITVPVALAAAVRRKPLLVYLPDIEPAVSVRFLGWMAQRIMATAEESRRFFDARKFAVSGYPIRRELLAAASQSKAGARQKFGIKADAKVLLVFGGSRGARSLNRALLANAERICRLADVIHVSGAGEWAEVSAARDRMSRDTQARYHAYPYLHAEMGDALAAADLVVSRAGASVLGEFPLFGLPSVLVPYPHAWRYQKVNADYLAGKGAAIVIEDANLPGELAPAVERLLQDVTAWNAMSRAARQLALPDAAESIARAVINLC
jgi:UDP-N-acetylglucosamine--N-acetylmuramyl-(pentapeptide) pyrophosphoryl-undecaprenol N-acetylglucosamine transferase